MNRQNAAEQNTHEHIYLRMFNPISAFLVIRSNTAREF